MTAREFWDDLAEWSQAAFGSDSERGPIGPLKHLEKEAREAYTELDEAPDKRDMEIVDCLFLVYDAARRAGMTFEGLYQLAEKKLAINRERTWIRTGKGDEPIEHDREKHV